MSCLPSLLRMLLVLKPPCSQNIWVMLVMLLQVSWIIWEFLNWQPAQQEIGKRGIWSHWLPSFPNIRGLPGNVQTLAWNSKFYHRDRGFHFRRCPIPSPSSISVLIISPCRLIFTQINQLPHFQARNRSAHLVVAHLGAFAQLSARWKSLPSHTQPSHWSELLAAAMLEFFILRVSLTLHILSILKRICEVN